MSRACLLVALVGICLGVGPSAAQKPAAGKVDFTVVQKREKPVRLEEHLVHDWLFQRYVIESIPTDKEGRQLPSAKPTQKLRIEAWGPHLLHAAAALADEWKDVTVFTSEDDERPPASYIRVRFKVITPASGRVAIEDHIFGVPETGKRRFISIVPIKAGDTWTRPFLDYWRKSGKKRRPVLDR